MGGGGAAGEHTFVLLVLPPSPPPKGEVEELEINLRQFSLGMGDYGLDDHHMDRTPGVGGGWGAFEDAYLSTPKAVHRGR